MLPCLPTRVLHVDEWSVPGVKGPASGLVLNQTAHDATHHTMLPPPAADACCPRLLVCGVALLLVTQVTNDVVDEDRTDRSGPGTGEW